MWRKKSYLTANVVAIPAVLSLQQCWNTVGLLDFEILKLSFPHKKKTNIGEVDYFLFPNMKATFRRFKLFYNTSSVFMLQQTITQLRELYCYTGLMHELCKGRKAEASWVDILILTVYLACLYLSSVMGLKIQPALKFIILGHWHYVGSIRQAFLASTLRGCLKQTAFQITEADLLQFARWMFIFTLSSVVS